MNALWITLRKEVRALATTWAAAAASLVAIAMLANSRNADLGWVAFFVGALTLAAMSIGHEYLHGTLPTLLSLPLTRSRLLLVKLAALLPMLVTLSIAALTVLPSTGDFGPSPLPLPALVTGLVAAPWLTMVCRGPLAGVLFASIPVAMSHIAAEAALVARYGWNDHRTADQLAFRDALLLASLLATAAIAAVAGWRTFMRLEAVGGAASGIDTDRLWPARRASPAPASTRRHPWWLLTLKELRLQQLTIVVTVLFAAGWAAVTVLWRNDPNDRQVLGAIAYIYYGALAVLIGSLAGAEERQIGTHEWQALLPIPAWQQWMVKLGTASGLALVVSVLMPTVMTDVSAVSAAHAGVVLLLTIGSLYVASLCRSGLQAMAWSVPVIVVVLLLLGSRLGAMVFTHRPLLAAALALAAVAATWFGFENHRTTTPAFSRVAWQAVVIAAGPLVAAIIAQWPR